MVINYSLLINIIIGVICTLFGILLCRVFIDTKLRNNKVIRKQAYTDPLTGRGNRYMFLSELDKLISKGKKFAVCFMDLDGFKQINDSMGHDAGDELLISLANTFDTKLPKNATSYRLGGDEFAIVINNVKTTEDVTKILDNLKEHLSKPIVIQNTSISLEYSVGISIYPEDASNKQDLVTYADDAMYYIKEHGKNDYYFHNKVLKAKLENKNKMQNDLKIGLEQNQFGVDFQPRIDVNDSTRLCFEVLLYWNHPVLERIDSAYFIKQADDMALTIKLDQFVLEAACKKLNYFKEKGYKNITMCVNISNKHSHKKDFINKLCNILNEYKIDKGEVQIQLISNIEVSNIEDYKLMFEMLKECGADIVINNMEIRYGSIDLYKDLPIDEIKVESKFLSDKSKIDPDILDDIIKMCKKLNYKVDVTKIETEKELNLAIKKGADKVQGNALFKRMDNDLVDEFISEYGNYLNKIDNIILSAKNMKNYN